MNKFTRKLVLLLAVLLTAGTLAGCGRTKVTLENYPTTVVATLGDTKIYLDEANYQARYNQYTSELYYNMYGYDLSDMWETDIGTGSTLEDYTKKNVMSAIYQTYVLKAKAEELGLALDEEETAKVAETVKSTMENMDEALKEATAITEERLTEILTNNALAMKAYEYAVKDVDTEVSDEEAAQRKISYILVKDGDDAAAAETLAEELKGKAEAGEDMSALADEHDNCTYSQATYGAGDYDNTLGNFGRTLATGEFGSVYDEGYGWYIVYCDSDFDQEATEKEKPVIVEQRKGELFQSAYAEWLKDMPKFKVDEDVWSAITFDKTLFVVPETTSGEEETTSAAGEETTTAETSESTSAQEETTTAAE